MLTFIPHSGVGSVTGANFELQSESARYLIDCGLLQGGKFNDDRNREKFPYNPADIDALFVTHAHIDHIGRIPKLVREGFHGVIYATPETKELAGVMLEDSLGVLEKEAKREGKEPLYRKEDVSATLALFEGRTYHKCFKVADGLSVEFFDAGHILGSAIVVFSRDGRSIAFTGDLGNSPAPLIRDTEIPKQVQYLIMESVYGDREHEGRDERKEKLRSVITDTIVRGGALIIPAFSLERTQILLYEINELVEGGTIRPVPVFLDSPLAIKVTDIYKRHGDVFRQEVQRDIEGGDDIFNFPNLQFTPTHQESEAIAKTPNPKIIIAGAGMSHAGRIQIHEKLFLPDPLSTVLIVGYQSAGSLGRKLVERAKHVRIGGTDVRVRARVEVLTGYSAHPDVNGLVAFAEGNVTTLKQVFVTMGELRASNFLAQRLRDYVGLNALVPTLGKAYHVEV